MEIPVGRQVRNPSDYVGVDSGCGKAEMQRDRTDDLGIGLEGICRVAENLGFVAF